MWCSGRYNTNNAWNANGGNAYLNNNNFYNTNRVWPCVNHSVTYHPYDYTGRFVHCHAAHPEKQAQLCRLC